MLYQNLRGVSRRIPRDSTVGSCKYKQVDNNYLPEYSADQAPYLDMLQCTPLCSGRGWEYCWVRGKCGTLCTCSGASRNKIVSLVGCRCSALLVSSVWGCKFGNKLFSEAYRRKSSNVSLETVSSHILLPS